MRKLACLVALMALAVIHFAAAPSVSAQGAPTEAAFDRIFSDVSSRVGRVISRTRFDGTWSYEGVVVNDNNLGCPNGQQNAPGQTRAWIVRVSVTGLGSYEYRVSNDSSIILYCSGVGIGAEVPQVIVAPPAAPPPAVGGARLPVPPPPGVSNQAVTFQAPIMAFIGRDGNVYVTSLSSNLGYVPLTGDALGVVEDGGYTNYSKYYGNLRWSPDGSRLAFVEYTTQTLYVASSGGQPFPVANGLAVEIPPSWSPDGAQIAFAARGAPVGDSPNFVYPIQAVPATGGPLTTVGQIAFGVGCGGGGFSPSLVNYYREVGYNGGNTIFKWLPNGFLHTARCDSVGLALTAFGGQRLWLADDISRMQIAPNLTRAAAVQYNMGELGSVVLVDLSNGAVSPIASPIGVDQVGWSSDSSTLLFATRQLTQQVGVNPGAQFGQQFGLANGQSYTLGLYAVPVAGGTLQQIYSSEGYSIGAITPSPNAALIAFTIAESEVAMNVRVNANDSIQNILSVAPRVKLGIAALPIGTPGYPYVLAADGGTPVFSPAITFTAMPATLLTVQPQAPVLPPAPPAAPTAVPALSATAGENPLGLVVNGRAIVPPGDTVVVRTSPQYLRDRSNARGMLRPNDTVRILSGPVFADNLRWWQVQRESDGFSGWVVDQYVDANGKVETSLQAIR
ncbi:MAG: hypothetical protein DYG88_08165 [Chloroflexi bacterium CFX4]|nr:hypothetical protein [Chloroflexi bacterium CFX4]MDL1921299.1 hypothetical protein [Chloroflexi bacterium CFX3]